MLIQFAVNDINGKWEGKLYKVMIPYLFEFETDFLNPVNIRKDIDRNGIKRLKFQRKIFPFQFCHEWAGSMAFNEYRMDIMTATELLNHVYRNDKWHCIEIDTELDNHLSQAPILPSDLLNFYEILNNIKKCKHNPLDRTTDDFGNVICENCGDTVGYYGIDYDQADVIDN